jgi:hypothetical protein
VQRHRDGERQARLYALEAGEVHCDPLRDVVERDGDDGHQPREGDAPRVRVRVTARVRFTARPRVRARARARARDVIRMVIRPEKATRRLRVALTADSPSMANALRFSLEGT